MLLYQRIGLIICKQSPFFLGLLLGIAVSLLSLPFLEEGCNAISGRIGRYNRDILQVYDDYEPIINLQGKPKNSVSTKNQKKNSNILRPRYFSSELGIRERLFLAILSQNSSFTKFGKTLNQTLGNYADKIVYFFPETQSKASFLPFQNIVFVDRRSFVLGVLEILSKTYLKSFDYFLLVPDDSYIRGSLLGDLLSSFSIVHDVYMGQLKTHSKNETFATCRLEGGILLSHSVLKATIPYLDSCLVQDNPSDPGYSLGQCLYQATKMHCSSSFMGKPYTTLEVKDEKPDKTRFHQKDAIVIYPIRDYKLHLHWTKLFRQQELKHVYKSLHSMKTKIESSSQFPVDFDWSQLKSWPGGVPAPFKANKRFDLIKWSYFNGSHLFLDDEFSTASRLSSVDRLDIEDLLSSCQKVVRREFPNWNNVQIEGGYRRFDPTRGMEYLLDFELQSNGKAKRIRLEAIRPLSFSEMISVPYVTEHTRLVLVLPVTFNKTARAVEFVKSFANICLEKQDNSVLVLILLDDMSEGSSEGSEQDPFYELKSLSNNYTNKYKTSSGRVVWMGLPVLHSRTKVSDFPVLDVLVRKLTPDSLILMCRTSMELRLEYLNRVRMNTIKGYQTFFPVPYAQYHPRIIYELPGHKTSPPPYVEVKSGMGYFDIDSYDHSAFYVVDYLHSRKMVEKTVAVARTVKDLMKSEYYKQDLPTLKDMFIAYKSLHIMRATEPDLRLWYEETTCFEHPPISTENTSDEGAEDKCLRDNVRRLGPKVLLASMIIKEGVVD